MKYINIVILFFIITGSVQAQLDPRLGYDMFKAGDFIDAIPELKKHLKIDPKDAKALFYIGYAYQQTNLDRSLSIKYLKKAYDTGKANKETMFYLAVGFTYKYNYEKAIELMQEYLKTPGKHVEEATALIKQYEGAKKLMKNPVSVTFENMGEKINSEFSDYAPFASKDEKILVFTTRRSGGKGKKEFDGLYPSDIMITKFNGTTFSKAKYATLNQRYDEACVGITDDGEKIFVYIDNIAEVGEIYESIKTGSNFSKKKKIKEGVNQEKTIETSASISSDGKTFFFASNRGEGFDLDLYMTRQLPNGNWALPQPIIALNSDGNEDFPTLSPDGKTLYFASDGLGGLGGYDLFKTEWNATNNTWGEPENLGYPINTAYDDKVICFAGNGKHAYVSQFRKNEGYGELDIYRVTYNEVEINPALFKISIQDAVTSKNIEKTKIYVFDADDEIAGEYTSKDGANIIMTLNPGKYSLEIEAEGYKLLIQNIKVSEFDYQKGMISKVFKPLK